jgi:hypothetical protein
VRTDPIRGYFDNRKGLNNGCLPSGCGPRVRELAIGLKLGTVLPNWDLSGA